MPGVMMSCQFCQQLIRKDRLGQHVKVRHEKELAQLLLERSGNNHFNPIRAVIKGFDPKNIPVFINNDDTSCYYFGKRARYFGDKDSFSIYVNDNDNMVEHLRFLNELITMIPLSDWLKKHDKTFEMMQENVALESYNAFLKERLKGYVANEFNQKTPLVLPKSFVFQTITTQE